jgi:hypothetical protein
MDQRGFLRPVDGDDDTVPRCDIGAVEYAVNPVPSITNLDPTSALAGSLYFNMKVNGSNFVDGAVVQWNGTARNTTFISDSQLSAYIYSTDIAIPGSASITVVNPAPGGGASNALQFSITESTNPTPAITSLNPASTQSGGEDFTLTVNGSDFVDGAVVQWNGAARTTTFIDETQLSAQINAADLTSQGSASITVLNPTPGGGVSNAVQFSITAPAGDGDKIYLPFVVR